LDYRTHREKFIKWIINLGKDPERGEGYAETTADLLDILDHEPTTEKRASWELFSFVALEGVRVEVVNKSYSASEERSYTVDVGGEIPFSCSCPAFKYREGPCKHMIAIAMDESLFDAGNAGQSMKADGGTRVEAGGKDYSDRRPGDCDCSPFTADFPCWPCYLIGFDEPNPSPEVSEE
jgi:hypothetical protein